MKKNNLFLITFFFPCILFAQNSKVDSLVAVLKTAKEDTSKVNILISLGSELRNNNPDKSIEYGKQAAELSDRLNFKRGIARANVLLGIANINLGKYDESQNYLKRSLTIAESIGEKPTASRAYTCMGAINSNQGNYEEALKNHFKALKIREQIGDKQGIAASYSNIGLVYQNQGKYDEALKNDLAALKIQQEIGDKPSIALTYNNIGIIYKEEGNYPEGLKNHLNALKIREEIQDKQGIAMSYSNIGAICFNQGNYSEALTNYSSALKIFEEIGHRQGIAINYDNIGEVYIMQKKYQEGLKNELAALKIREELGDKQGIATTYHCMGIIYKELRNYPEALKNQMAAAKLFEEIGDKSNIADTYEAIGEVYFLMSNYSNAITWLNNALKEALDINEKRIAKEIYVSLAEVYERLNDYKKAYAYHKLYSDMKDTLLNESSSKQITEMKTKYETDKKDNQIQLLNKDKEIQTTEIKRQTFMKNSFFGGFAVVLLFAGVFFTQRNRISKGKKRSDELLLNILPSETAEELKQTGTAKAKSYDMVTVLFTDFKNFTQVSEKKSAEELVNEIHYYYSEFDKIIAKHNIEKIKTIGDSYMCAGGLPVENQTNPIEMVQAALEIQQFIAKEKEERQKSNKPFFEIRTGINTGAVVAGIVGIKKFAYDIWGDTVNIASRMESSGEVGKVNISSSTYDLVKDKFTCAHRGKIDAKNKGMIDMYFVEGAISEILL